MTPRPARFAVAAIVVAGFLNLAPRASAEFIDLQYLGNNGGSANVKLDGTDYMTRPLGAFFWKDVNDPPNGNFPPPITTFCIELEQGLPQSVPLPLPLPPLPPTAIFKVTDLAAAPTINSAAKADAIRALYGNNYDFAANQASGGLNSAFQLALWELVYDFGGPLDLNAGRFTSTAVVANPIAQGMLDNLAGGLAKFNASGYDLVALVAPAGVDENGVPAKTQDQVQDHITIRPKAVPAPPAVLLAGLGVLALIGRARWNRKPVAAA